MIEFCQENSYIRLPPCLYTLQSPEPVSNPTLLALNRSLAQEIGLKDNCHKETLAQIFSGNRMPPGARPLALAYAGHQFGHFVPRLGDGRAILLGEALTPKGKRLDVQLKGSGRTPYSRNGDGKSALGPVIREYIVAEAMHCLGVPVTRPLAAVSTGEQVFRETPLPGGILVRTATGHLRIGTFQYAAIQENQKNILQSLLDFSIQRHHPELADSKDAPLLFLRKVADTQISLVTRWMALGFIHGVMNTDNTTISGETIDFGPCAFLDEFHRNKVFSYIDQKGRYAWGNQGNILLWNLSRLAESLIPLVEDSPSLAVEKLEEALKPLPRLFKESLENRMGAKLGLSHTNDRRKTLISRWLHYLEDNRLDYTLSFRKLPLLLKKGAPESLFPPTSALKTFLEEWKKQKPDVKVMEQVNPCRIPRNHLVEQAIKQANQGDLTLFEKINRAMEEPYREKVEFQFLETPPTPKERVRQTFCGT